MNWFFQFWNSSVGKKITMATTGILLCLFLIIHLIGNLFLFGGAEAFNGYVTTLSAVRPVVRVIEAVLVLLFFFHIFNAVRLTIENRRSKPIRYTVNEAAQNSDLTSRTMFVTGSILFLFLVVHLSTFWWQFQIEHEGGQFYAIVMGPGIGFANILVTALYAVAMFILGFHLRHGFQSAFQTFGIRYNKYGKLIEAVAVFFWLIIPLGFLSIPVYFGLLKGGF